MLAVRDPRGQGAFHEPLVLLLPQLSAASTPSFDLNGVGDEPVGVDGRPRLGGHPFRPAATAGEHRLAGDRFVRFIPITQPAAGRDEEWTGHAQRVAREAIQTAIDRRAGSVRPF